jgi:hypothetical protein
LGFVGLGLLVAACGSSDKSRRVLGIDGGPEAGVTPDAAPSSVPPPKRPLDAAIPKPDAPSAKSDARASLPPGKEAGPPDSGPTDASVPLVGVFVNPSTGLDANAGTQAAPVKKIAHAVSLAKAGDTIYLEDGVYDATTQTTLSVNFPAGVSIRGVTKTGAVLKSNGTESGFGFAGAGGVHDLTFDTFANGITASGSGTFDVANVHFKNSARPFYFQGSLVVTVDATGTDPIVSTPVADGLGAAVLVADGTANVTFVGGDVSGVNVADSEMFFARGASKLTLDGTTLRDSKVRGVLGYDNADIVLKNVTMSNLSFASSGIDNNVIVMGGQNTAPPLDPSLELIDTSVSGNQIGGIGFSLYSNLDSKPVITFTRSHVNGNKGNGLVIAAVAGAQPGLVATVNATDSTFDTNTLAGVDATIGTVSVTGGEISGNGGNGLALSGAAMKNSLVMRGGTAVKDNAGHGISFAGLATSTLDLGRKATPGGIVFTGVAAAHSAVNLLAGIQGFAVGNTWLSNVQGASATGLYTGTVSIVGAAAGQNVTAVAGSSLVVSE